MSTDPSQRLPVGLDQLAAVSPDIPFRHFYTRIDGDDRSDFGPRLSRLLDNLARVRAGVLHLSTSAVMDDGELTRVAQLVIQMDQQTIDTLKGNAPASAPLQIGGEELIGFPTPPRGQSPT